MNDKWKVEEWRSKIDFVFGMRRIVFTIQYNPIWLHTDARSHICALTLTPTAHEHAHDAQTNTQAKMSSLSPPGGPRAGGAATRLTVSSGVKTWPLISLSTR